VKKRFGASELDGLFIFSGGSTMVPLAITSHDWLNTTVGVTVAVAMALWALTLLVALLKR
jgi:hypothetical protein